MKRYIPLLIGLCTIFFSAQEPTALDAIPKPIVNSNAEDFINYLDESFAATPAKAFEALQEYLKTNGGTENFSVADRDNIYYALGKYSMRSFDLENGRYYIDEGIKQLNENKITKGLSNYYNLKAGYYYFQNKKDSAVLWYLKTLDALKNEGQKDKIPFLLNNIGIIYESQKNFKRSTEYLQKAYDALTSDPNNQNTKFQSTIAGNLSQSYFEIEEFENAELYATKAIALEKDSDFIEGSLVAYSTKAYLAERSNKKDSVKIYAMKAYELAVRNNDTYRIATAATNLSLLLEDKTERIKYAKIAYDINKKENTDGFLYDNVKTLALLNYELGNYRQAAPYLHMYLSYQDSIHQVDLNAKTLDILERYETAEKELTIAEQKSEIIEKESQQRTFMIVLLALGALGLLGLLFVRQRQKTQQQKIVALENERENIALRSLMAGEEKERSRIAKELHDGLGGILAAAKIHASQGNNPAKVMQLLDTASKESRRISHNMLPESLMVKGLDKALEDFVHSINESGLLTVSYQSINLDENLPQPLQLSVYRIIQELLNNIIKHSGATEALVQIQQESKKLAITVEDDGKGFASKDARKGIGLQNIESRISLLNGNMEIDSQNKKGTSVYIELQLKK